MHPFVCGSVSTYFLLWGVAAMVCIGGGTGVAARAGFPAGRSAAALTLLGVAIVLGSKGLYLLETRYFPFDSFLPIEVRTRVSGFRIPGGILALAFATTPVCAALGLPWRRFGDRLIPCAALMLLFVRLGCFLNGCCFGTRSGLPWATAFARGSWAFWYQQTHGWIAPDAPAALPVHPLQLYFALAAVAMVPLLVRHQRRDPQPGSTQLLFYFLFFATTALLEGFREESLTLNRWLCWAASAVTGGLLLARAWADRVPAPVAVEVPR